MSVGSPRADEPTSTRPGPQPQAPGASPKLSLHVIRDGHASTLALTIGHSLVIGRGRDADVRIDDAAVSRRHLSLEYGAALRLTDLGSVNGALVGGRRLRRGESTTIEPGTVIELAGALLVVRQPGASEPPPRRVWTHGYFEGRLQDECARAERHRDAFAVLRAHVDVRDEPAALDALSSHLGFEDALAVYAPGEIEALVVGPTPAAASDIEARAREWLAQARIVGRVGASTFPRDGRAGDALLAAANDRATAGGAPAAGRRTYGHHIAELERTFKPIACGDINVLICGETGVGKEIVAARIVALSPRARKPLLKLNCGAFTETLLASELFGHERGSFTGADRAKAGLLESADGGTVFLDEIGELPLALQPKLLRVLEDGDVMRVGALRPKHVDVRFIAATNRDLESEAAAGRFRSDLYYRLAGFVVDVSPLRDRRDEIADLARGLVADLSETARCEAPAISGPALALLGAYAWPGNVRELRNVMQRALLLAAGDAIGVEHLPVEKLLARVAAPPAPHTGAIEASGERARIIEALSRVGGNQTHAARALGVSRGTLLSRMDTFGLVRPRKRPNGS